MNFLLSLPLTSPASRRLNREMRLSLQAVLTGCVLGFLLMLLVTLASFLSPAPIRPGNAASALSSDR